jgi:hypothetical protein
MKAYLPAMTLALGIACAAVPAFAQDTATIVQSGTSSAALITQVGNFGVNDAAIRQGVGTANNAQITQTNLGTPAFNTNAFARIEQDGNRNTANLTETVSGNVAGTILQQGDDNRALGTVENSDRTAFTIDQNGFGNQGVAVQARIVEQGGVFVQQIGDNNVADVSQHDGGFLRTDLRQIGNVNTAHVDQSGDVGSIDVTQNGDSGMVMVTQVNMGLAENTVSITQGGTNNVATVTQVGNGFTASITQGPGSFNSATINQSF